MLFLRSLFAVFLISSFAANAESKGGSGRNFFFIEAGGYVNNIKERLSAPSGYASKLSSFKGYFRIHPGFHLGKNWHFEPSLGTMVPTRDGTDGNNSVFESQLALQLSAPIFSFLKFRLGPGIEWVCLLSKNQSIDLNNGTDISTFYTPARASNVFLFTVTAGLSIRLHNRWMIGMDVYVPEVLSTLRKRYNASMTLGYRL